MQLRQRRQVSLAAECGIGTYRTHLPGQQRDIAGDLFRGRECLVEWRLAPLERRERDRVEHRVRHRHIARLGPVRPPPAATTSAASASNSGGSRSGGRDMRRPYNSHWRRKRGGGKMTQ